MQFIYGSVWYHSYKTAKPPVCPSAVRPRKNNCPSESLATPWWITSIFVQNLSYGARFTWMLHGLHNQYAKSFGSIDFYQEWATIAIITENIKIRVTGPFCPFLSFHSGVNLKFKWISDLWISINQPMTTGCYPRKSIHRSTLPDISIFVSHLCVILAPNA